MSRNQGVRFRDRLLFANTISLQTALGLLVEFGRTLETADEPWFADLLDQWTVQSFVRDFGMTLDDGWSAAQVDVVRQHLHATRRGLGSPNVEALLADRDWAVGAELVGEGMHAPVELVAQVLRAVELLLAGDVPADPAADAAWLVGWDPDAWLSKGGSEQFRMTATGDGD